MAEMMMMAMTSEGPVAEGVGLPKSETVPVSTAGHPTSRCTAHKPTASATAEAATTSRMTHASPAATGLGKSRGHCE